MGFRFRRSFRLFPGVRVNVGTRGVSVSVGRRGAQVTVGARGTRTTLGVPGTGLLHTTFTPHADAVVRERGRAARRAAIAYGAEEAEPSIFTRIAMVGLGAGLLAVVLIIGIFLVFPSADERAAQYQAAAARCDALPSGTDVSGRQACIARARDRYGPRFGGNRSTRETSGEVPRESPRGP